MEIYKKMLEAREIIASKKVKKDGHNDYSKYNYFTPENVSGIVNEVCGKLKLLPLFSLKKDELGYFGELTIINVEQPTEIIITIMRTEKPALKATNDTQQMGGCETYTKRYMLMSAFNISDNTLDFDRQDNRGKIPQSKPVEKKSEVKYWLSEEDYKEALKIESVKKLRDFIIHWCSEGRGMKKEYKDCLVKHGTELKQKAIENDFNE